MNTALVATAARSEPAPGSLNSWQHSRSERRKARAYLARCSAVPNVAMVGPTSPQVTLISSVDWGGSKACSSSVKATTYRMDRPAPPSSSGSAIAPYPASYRCLR